MNRTQLEQVLLNLVLNAADVVGSGGAVHVRVGPGAAPQTALIEVEDNGPGIDEDVLEHLRALLHHQGGGQRHRLGLLTARGIVEEAGTIEVETSDQGTCFRVTLPRLPARPHPSPARRPAPRRRRANAPAGGRRRWRPSLLAAAGPRGMDGRGLLGPHSGAGPTPAREAPAALITDVIMPCMNGRQLAMAAMRVHPVPVLYISGYTADVLGGDRRQRGLLHKPFSPERLLDAVRAGGWRPGARG